MTLTKDIFLQFMRCYKLGYLELLNKGTKSVHYEPSFRQDTDLVKSFGEELFKGGRKCLNPNEAIEAVNAPLSQDSIILYTPSFTTPDGTLSFSGDILSISERLNWLTHFNNSTMIRLPEHIFDIGFQYKVLDELNLERKIKFRIAYLNKGYVREKLIDIEQLFTIEDVTFRARDNQVLINREIAKINRIIEKNVIPQAKVGNHCIKPEKCNFFDYCWSKVSKGSIHNISGLTTKQVRYLEDNGINNIQDIPDDFKLSNRTLAEIKAVFRNKPILKRNKVQNWFNKIDASGPISFLNIETFESAIPLFENCKPYETLPYQFCLLFRSNEFSEFKQREFIADSNVDPRLQFIQNLLKDMDVNGPIVIYKYSTTVLLLNNISNIFPEYKQQISSIINRFWDLSIPINNGWYFHHTLSKRKDIRNVLAALDNDKLYENLKIKDSKTSASNYRLVSAFPIVKSGQMLYALKDFCFAQTKATCEVFEIFNSM